MAQKKRQPAIPIVRTLAKNIRLLRHLKGLSQEALAEECGLHRTYVGSVERAERNVTLNTLETLASTLGVSVPELLQERGADDEAI